MTVQAAWYPDPHVAGQVRWFDGARWSAHTAPAQSARESAGAHPDDVVHWLVPTGRSWQAVAAGYVGLVALVVWPLGPVAVVLGVLGLRARGHGRPRSVFAVVTGALATIALVAVLVQAVTS